MDPNSVVRGVMVIVGWFARRKCRRKGHVWVSEIVIEDKWGPVLRGPGCRRCGKLDWRWMDEMLDTFDADVKALRSKPFDYQATVALALAAHREKA